MNCISLICFKFLLFLCFSNGQVQQEGKFNSKARQIYFGKRVDSGMNDSKFKIQVPFHDSKALLEAEEALKSTSSLHSAPITFAKAIPMEIDSRFDGVWEEDINSNVKTWSLLIESKTALGIALIFDNFHIIDDGEMYIMNDSGVLGAFTRANNKADGKFSVQPLKGSNICIIYIEPLKSVKPLNFFKIGKVVHAYRNIFNQDKSISGTCNVDVRCINAFNDQKRATVVFMTDQLQKFCTGAMINNAKGDGRQLLLTANHCVFTDLSNSIAGFNYEKLGCFSSAVISNPQTAHGMKLLARASTSDFALFEVIEKIPQSYNVYLSGWDANIPTLGVSDTYAGIHHPSGDVKKISLFTGKIKLSSWSEGPNKNYHIEIPKWSRGVTEPGSSGSPLFNSNGNLIGQLHGGASSCGNLEGADLYGGFAFSYGDNGSGISLKTILDPNNLIKNLKLAGKNLYGSTTISTISTTVTPTATSTATVTVTSTVVITTCPCVPKVIVDKLVQSYESRIKMLEK